MGLEVIVSAIASEAAAQVSAARASGLARVDETLTRARSRAESERQHWAGSRDAEAERASARIVNRARLQADRELAQARELLFQSALERLMVRLEAIVGSPAYESILRDLYLEARQIVADADAVVRCRAADEPLLERLLAEAGGSQRVEPTLECMGGLDIETLDGRAVRNTLDARLTKSERQLRFLAIENIPELAILGGDA